MHKSPSENAIIEINNILSMNQSNIENIDINQIIEIANKYKVDLQKQFKDTRLLLFQTYLYYCLRDNK